MSTNSDDATRTASTQKKAETESNTKKNAWDKLEGEGGGWYARFLTYLKLGPQRGIEKLYRQRKKVEKGLKGDRPNSQWHKIAKEWRWKERADAYDHAQQVIVQEQTEDGRIEAHEKRLELIDKNLLIVTTAIEKADLPNMDTETARRHLPTLVKFFGEMLAANRLERGEPTSIAVNDNTDHIVFSADDLAEAQRQLAEHFS